MHNIQKTGLFSEIQKVIQKVLRLLKKWVHIDEKEVINKMTLISV